MSYRSDEIDKLAAALAKAQASFKPVSADRKVSIKTRDGGTYHYDYATLSAIWEVIRKPLADNGLSVVQLIVGNELLTILMHESGQSVISTMPLPPNGDIKGFGANISYIRRYALAPLVGVAVGEEDDENVTAGNIEPKPKQAQPQKPTETTANKWEPTTKEEFFNHIETELKISTDEAKLILKDAGYTGFSKEKAGEMFKAVQKEIIIRKESAKIQERDNGKMFQDSELDAAFPRSPQYN